MYKFISIGFLISFIFACSHKPTEPPEEDKLCEITDTTEHNFSWRTDILGVFPSVLYDVAAIDPQNVWAVGEIERSEISGEVRYNAVKWNGNEYEYYQKEIEIYDGAKIIAELYSAIAFSTDNIWLFSLGSYLHWDGQNWTTKYIGDYTRGSLTDAWGASPDDFYLVGTNGSITHWDGNEFTLMESGTNVDLFQVKGHVDPVSGEKVVWVLGWNRGKSVVLKYEEGIWKNVWSMENPILENNYIFPRAMFIPDVKTLVMTIWNVGQSGLFCFDQNDFNNNKLLIEHQTDAIGLVGTGINDLVVSGSLYSTEHFNGSGIYLYEDLLLSGIMTGISNYQDNIYIVGDTDGQQAVFIRGKR